MRIRRSSGWVFLVTMHLVWDISNIANQLVLVALLTSAAGHAWRFELMCDLKKRGATLSDKFQIIPRPRANPGPRETLMLQGYVGRRWILKRSCTTLHPHYSALHHTTPHHYRTPHYTTLHWTTPHHITRYFTPLCTIPFDTTLHSTRLDSLLSLVICHLLCPSLVSLFSFFDSARLWPL